jgi:predicted DNA-binding transcriptional regulator YafY
MKRTFLHPAVKDFLVGISGEVEIDRLAELAEVDPRTIKRAIKTYRETGNAVKARSGNGKEKVLTAVHIAVSISFYFVSSLSD